MLIIDSHLHLFDLTKGDYAWLKPENPPFWPDKSRIHRDFSVADLTLAAPMQLAGFVHIEAGFNNQQPWLEIEWLQQHSSMPFKSIAAIDLGLPYSEFLASIHKLQGYASVVGVRHILDEQAQQILATPATLQNLRLLNDASYIFETQLSGIDDVAIDLLVEIAQHLPTLTIILSHANFCPHKENELRSWQHNIDKLAGCHNIIFKASGWEMVARDYAMTHVAQAVVSLIDSVGVKRVMLGSNFPLCLVSTSYADLWQDYQQLPLTPAQLTQLQYGNAKRVYGF